MAPKKRIASEESPGPDVKRKRTAQLGPQAPRRSARIKAVQEKASMMKKEGPVPDSKLLKTKTVRTLKKLKKLKEPATPKKPNISKVIKKPSEKKTSVTTKATEKAKHKREQDSQTGEEVKKGKLWTAADDNEAKAKTITFGTHSVKEVRNSIQANTSEARSALLPTKDEFITDGTTKIKDDCNVEPDVSQRIRRPILTLDTKIESAVSSRSPIKQLHSQVKQPHTITKQDQGGLKHPISPTQLNSSKKSQLSPTRRSASPLKLPPNVSKQAVRPTELSSPKQLENSIKMPPGSTKQPVSPGKSPSRTHNTPTSPLKPTESPLRRSQSPIRRPESPLKRSQSPLKQLGSPLKRPAGPTKPNNPPSPCKQLLNAGGYSTDSAKHLSKTFEAPNSVYQRSYTKPTAVNTDTGEPVPRDISSEQRPADLASWILPQYDLPPAWVQAPESPISPLSKTNSSKTALQNINRSPIPANIATYPMPCDNAFTFQNHNNSSLSTDNSRPSVGQPPTPAFDAHTFNNSNTNAIGSGPRSPRPVSKASSSSQPDRPPTPRPLGTTAIGPSGTEEQRALQNIYYLEMIKKVTERNDDGALKLPAFHDGSESGMASSSQAASMSRKVVDAGVVPEGVAQGSPGRYYARDGRQGNNRRYENDNFYSRGNNISEQQRNHGLQLQHNDESDIDAAKFHAVPMKGQELQRDEEASLRSRSLFGDSDYSGEESEATSKAWD